MYRYNKKSFNSPDWLAKNSLPLKSNPKNRNFERTKLGKGKMQGKVIKKFEFDKALNTNFLNQFYGENIKLASKIFHVFLSHTFKDFSELIRQMKSMEWGQICSKVHQIRPNFKVVGLTQIYEKLIYIESKGRPSLKLHYLKILERIFFELKYKYVPILKKEVLGFQQYLQLIRTQK